MGIVSNRSNCHEAVGEADDLDRRSGLPSDQIQPRHHEFVDGCILPPHRGQ